MKNQAIIELKDISLHREDTEILKNINWSIHHNEHWVLFGRNGSGKTKLLEVITGYTLFSSGTLIRFGESYPGIDIRTMRKSIGYVSTSIERKFSFHEKVIDVVLSGYYASIGLYQEPEELYVHQAHELLRSIQLERAALRNFGTLSDGEKRKIMILRALVTTPALLILDEPAAGLDIGAREDLLADLEKIITEKKVPAIFVTHHTDEIIPLFENILILHNGSVFLNGKTEHALTTNVLSDIFQRDIEVEKKGNRFYSYVV